MHFVERRGRTCRGDGGEASRYPRMITDAGPFAQRSDLKWPETLIIRWCPALERIGRTPGTGSRQRSTPHATLGQRGLSSCCSPHSPLHPNVPGRATPWPGKVVHIPLVVSFQRTPHAVYRPRIARLTRRRAGR